MPFLIDAHLLYIFAIPFDMLQFSFDFSGSETKAMEITCGNPNQTLTDLGLLDGDQLVVEDTSSIGYVPVLFSHTHINKHTLNLEK